MFAGTSEGRELAQFLAGQKIPASVCVATEYGEEVLPDMPGIQVITGRMDQEQMEKLINRMRPLAVIDATHPYAEAVTENIGKKQVWRRYRESASLMTVRQRQTG